MTYKKSRKFFVFFSIFLWITSVVSPIGNVVHASDIKVDYSDSNIEFYDPNDTDCSSAGTSDVDVSGANNETVFKFLISTSISANGNKPLNAVQAAGVMGNFEAESGMNPSAIEKTSRTDKGHGLAQWTFGRWNNLEAYAASKGKPWDDLQLQLDFLITELEGPEKKVLSDTDFAQTSDPAVAAQRWRKVFERASETLAHDSRRIQSAIAFYNQFKDLAPEASSSSSYCGGTSVINGDVVQTALSFAWETPVANGKKNKSDAKPSYQEGMPKYNGSTGSDEFSDCGVFVATVMIASGVDPDYPKRGTAAQKSYVQSNPSKYQIINNPTMDQLQPGDVLIFSAKDGGSSYGHTLIYTGENNGYVGVDASLHQRVPSVRDAASVQWTLNKIGTIAARYIGGK